MRPRNARNGITLTTAGIAALTLTACGSAEELSAEELNEILASETQHVRSAHCTEEFELSDGHELSCDWQAGGAGSPQGSLEITYDEDAHALLIDNPYVSATPEVPLDEDNNPVRTGSYGAPAETEDVDDDTDEDIEEEPTVEEGEPAEEELDEDPASDDDAEAVEPNMDLLSAQMREWAIERDFPFGASHRVNYGEDVVSVNIVGTGLETQGEAEQTALEAAEFLAEEAEGIPERDYDVAVTIGFPNPETSTTDRWANANYDRESDTYDVTFDESPAVSY